MTSPLGIAWTMLTHRKEKFLVMLSGISFGILGLFLGLGMFKGFVDGQTRIARIVKADLIVISRKTQKVGHFRDISRRNLFRVRSMPSVTQVIPVVEGQAKLRGAESGMGKTIQFLAFPVDSDPFRIPGAEKCFPLLRKRGSLVFDSASREIYGTIREGMTIELDGLLLQVVGTLALGPNFGRNGYLFMSDETLVGALDSSYGERMSFGLIRFAPGTDVRRSQEQIRVMLGKELLVLTPDELQTRELWYTILSTPFGSLLGLGFLAAFFIGVSICYQILYNETAGHLPQFATLKAMGFSDVFLIRIVLSEALLLGIMGLPPGIVGGTLLFKSIQLRTSIPTTLSPILLLSIFVCTLLMCIVAAVMALEKSLSSDPASLY